MQRIANLGAITERVNGSLNGMALEPLVISPPLPRCELCAIIPVRDEAENLEIALQALAHQIDLEGQLFDRRRYEIVVLANNCSDDSAAIARNFARQHPTLALHVVEITLPPAEAHVAKARRILMDEAYRRLASLGRRRGIIASTDGDSQVAPTWVAATLHEMTCGVDAVGGRILTDRASRSSLNPAARSYHLREVAYRYLLAELECNLEPDPHDPWPRHYQHFGASFAITAEMYARVGGLPVVRSPEDVALYRALCRADARFRHSPAVRVFTSARTLGRTQNGLSNQLSEWAVMGSKQQPFLVESPQEIETRLRMRRQLRVLWQRSHSDFLTPDASEIAQLAIAIGVSPEWLTLELQQPQTFGSLIEQVEQSQSPEQHQTKKVEIKEAINYLRVRLESLRRGRRTLNPLEQVEPILLFALASQMPQLGTSASEIEERVVNLIASQGVVAGVERPMDEQ